jgi:hypothetical protein
MLLIPTVANAFTIEWSPTSTAVSYDIQRSIDNAPWTTIGVDVTCIGLICSYEDKTTPIGSVRYRIVSKNTTGSIPTASFCGVENPAPPPIVFSQPAMPQPVDSKKTGSILN